MHIILEAYGKYGIMVACKSHTGHTDICMEYHTESHDTKYHKMPQNNAKMQCRFIYVAMSFGV